MKRTFTKRVMTVGVACASALGVLAGPSGASTPGCGPRYHCYSILKGSGTTYYGLYGTWNRADMTTGGATTRNGRFINSEMWLLRNGSTPQWVEVGMKHGYFIGTGSTGYMVFGEWGNGNAWGWHKFGNIRANRHVTDEFQIGHGAARNGWRVLWDGKGWRTGRGPGFWTSRTQEIGAEVATSRGWAQTFNMHARGITRSGRRVRLAHNYPARSNDTRAGTGLPVLRGRRPASSDWQWWI